MSIIELNSCRTIQTDCLLSRGQCFAVFGSPRYKSFATIHAAIPDSPEKGSCICWWSRSWNDDISSSNRWVLSKVINTIIPPADQLCMISDRYWLMQSSGRIAVLDIEKQELLGEKALMELRTIDICGTFDEKSNVIELFSVHSDELLQITRLDVSGAQLQKTEQFTRKPVFFNHPFCLTSRFFVYFTRRTLLICQRHVKMGKQMIPTRVDLGQTIRDVFAMVQSHHIAVHMTDNSFEIWDISKVWTAAKSVNLVRIISLRTDLCWGFHKSHRWLVHNNNLDCTYIWDCQQDNPRPIAVPNTFTSYSKCQASCIF